MTEQPDSLSDLDIINAKLGAEVYDTNTPLTYGVSEHDRRIAAVAYKRGRLDGEAFERAVSGHLSVCLCDTHRLLQTTHPQDAEESECPYCQVKCQQIAIEALKEAVRIGYMERGYGPNKGFSNWAIWDGRSNAVNRACDEYRQRRKSELQPRGMA